MAIFSNKTEDKEKKSDKLEAKASSKEQAPAPLLGAHTGIIVQPRISEKANTATTLNKFIFKVKVTANKPEIRKAVEKAYGVKVDKINIIRNAGKVRRAGGRTGRTSAYKKAIVTLKPDSKKPTFYEAA